MGYEWQPAPDQMNTSNEFDEKFTTLMKSSLLKYTCMYYYKKEYRNGYIENGKQRFNYKPDMDECDKRSVKLISNCGKSCITYSYSLAP